MDGKKDQDVDIVRSKGGRPGRGQGGCRARKCQLWEKDLEIIYQGARFYLVLPLPLTLRFPVLARLGVVPIGGSLCQSFRSSLGRTNAHPRKDACS
jgi:hypothetical protein